MTLPANRVGGVRGPEGTTLDDLRAEQQATNIYLQQMIDVLQGVQNGLTQLAYAIGSPDDTDCLQPLLTLLCNRLPAVEEPPPDPYLPVFRCGNLFMGRSLFAYSWRLEPAFPLSGDGFWCPETWYTSSGPGDIDIDAQVVELPDTGEGVGVVVFVSPNPARETVCIEAKNPAGSVQSVFWQRYSIATGALITSGGLGVVDPSELWTEGVTFNVDPDSYYTFHPSLAEGFEGPEGFELYITEGALG